MTFRKTIFWLHLAAGCVAGVVILLMSATGVLLAFERQMVAWAERDLRASEGETRMAPVPPSRLVAAAVATADAKPSNVIVRSDPHAPVTVAFGRERTLFVNRYTGQVLGDGATGLRHFFTVNEDLHRWLALKGDGREKGKSVTGAANLVFLFIVLSGLVLWFPRNLTGRAFGQALWFRRGARGRARDFNWHHVFGIWMFVPLVAIVFSGVVISYPWASALVYRAFGSTPPPPQAQSRPEARGGERDRARDDGALLDRIWTVASTEASRSTPGWQSISLRLPLPSEGKLNVALDSGNGARPDKRSQLVVDATSGRVLEHKTYSQQESGQQARAWLRWIHTGEAGGVTGQFIAMIASAAAVMLVWTGIALSLRRFARSRRSTPVSTRQIMEEEGIV